MEFLRRERMTSAAFAALLALLPAPAANAADQLRVGKAVLQSFAYIPLDIGLKYGQFDKQELQVQAIVFAGAAKATQAAVAGSVDIVLGSGPGMAFTAKGAPYLAVAAITDSMKYMGIDVPYDSTAKNLDDLKGKKIGVTSTGSLSSWLVDELNRFKGWQNGDRASAVTVGGDPTAEYAAFRTGQIDAAVSGISLSYELEERKQARALVSVTSYVKPIPIFVTFATDAIIQKDPDALRRFLVAWFEAVRYMANHRAETVAMTSEALRYSPGVAAQMYDALMPTFSSNGRFTKAALDRLHASMVESNAIDGATDMSKLYDERFLPASR